MADVGFQITGPAASSYSTGVTTCGSELNKGSSCTVPVVFTPMSGGANAAVLTVSSSTLGVAAIQVPLMGIGQAASGLTITPAELAFTEPVIGSPSPPQLATITNTSTAAADGIMLSTTGPFSLTQNGCGTILAVGASCTTGIVFTPIADGVAIGTLPCRPLDCQSRGGCTYRHWRRGGNRADQADVTEFRSNGCGVVSATQLVSVTNSGAVTLTDLAVTASSGFRVVDSTCGSTLAPAASCTATVAFRPKSRPADRVSDDQKQHAAIERAGSAFRHGRRFLSGAFGRVESDDRERANRKVYADAFAA